MRFATLRFPSQRYNVQTLRTSPLSEISGALGDLGTLLPLIIALTLSQSIVLSTTLVFTGLANILTGLFFSIPLPVQPMKAIAAVAIANNFSITETTSAGLFVAGCVFVMSVTGILQWVGRVVPIPVVKGIQVGAGLTLVIGAGEKIMRPLGWTTPNGGDNLIWAIAAFILLLITTGPSAKGSKTPRVPYALLVFIVGLAIALISLYSGRSTHYPIADLDSTMNHEQQNISATPRHPSFFSFWHPRVYIPTPRAFRDGALIAGLGQLPLTTLNSIIAVTHLSAELIPSPPGPSTPSFTTLGISVALMNLIPAWFGSMPVCHGSGGLAGQYKFGARSGASIVMLGLFKLVLGLFVNGDWLVRVLERFPKSLLGIMVIAAGVELARVGEGLNAGARDLWVVDAEPVAGGDSNGQKMREVDDQERLERWTVMMITVAGILAFKNDGVGFIAGLLCHWSIGMPRYWEMWRQRSRNSRAGVEGVGLLQGERT